MDVLRDDLVPYTADEPLPANAIGGPLLGPVIVQVTYGVVVPEPTLTQWIALAIVGIFRQRRRTYQRRTARSENQHSLPSP